MNYKDMAQHEAFEEYVDEALTLAKDYLYASKLFDIVDYIYNCPDSESRAKDLIDLMRNDNEAVILTLVDEIHTQTKERLEARLNNPVRDSEKEEEL